MKKNINIDIISTKQLPVSCHLKNFFKKTEFLNQLDHGLVH